MHYLEPHIRSTTVFKVGNKIWFLKLDENPQNSGWKKFIEDHNLQPNSLLHLWHIGVMTFRVQIFNPDHCTSFYKWNIVPIEPHMHKEYGKTNINTLYPHI